MLSYIYIIIIVCTILYSVYRDIVIYKKGEYSSYPFTQGKKNILFNIILVIILLGGIFFIAEDKTPALVNMFYIVMPISVTKMLVFNYIFYRKTKNKKILFDTLMYIIMVIIIFTSILKSQ